MKSEKYFKNVDKSGRSIERLADILVADINRLRARGVGALEAVALAWDRNDVPARLENAIIPGIYQAVQDGGVKVTASVNAFGSWYLSKTWPGDGLTLSSRIHDVSRRAEAITRETIRQQLDRNRSWTALAKAVDDQQLITGDISGPIRNISKLGTKSLSPQQNKIFQRELKKAKSQVERLAQNGAPTTRLKKAYENVIKQVESGTEKSIKNAVDRAVRAKSRYNAERLSRTEMAKAYGRAKETQFLNDDDVVAWKWTLSTRHLVDDICDLHAGADLYGLGPGIYPVDKGPVYPAHPMCLCVLNPVYGEELKGGEFDPEAGKKYIEKSGKGRAILGKSGEEAVKKGGDWQVHAKSYAGQEDKQRQIPLKI